MDSPPPMADQLRELIMLLRDVADCGVEVEDERVKYVTVQIDRETWKQLQAYRSPRAAMSTNADGRSTTREGDDDDAV